MMDTVVGAGDQVKCSGTGLRGWDARPLWVPCSTIPEPARLRMNLKQKT